MLKLLYNFSSEIFANTNGRFSGILQHGKMNSGRVVLYFIYGAKNAAILKRRKVNK